MEFMYKGCFLWKIKGVENWNIIDLCKKYLEMSFGIFGNEFWHFGNEFCLFSGNEFRPKRAKKSLEGVQQFWVWSKIILLLLHKYFFVYVLPQIPLTLYLLQERRISRSTHCRATNPICFWIAYSWRVSLFWSHSISLPLCRERAKNTSILLFSPYSLYCCTFTIFLQMKISVLKNTILDF